MIFKANIGSEELSGNFVRDDVPLLKEVVQGPSKESEVQNKNKFFSERPEGTGNANENRSDDSSTFISKVKKAMKRSAIDNQVENLEEDEAIRLAKNGMFDEYTRKLKMYFVQCVTM